MNNSIYKHHNHHAILIVYSRYIIAFMSRI